MHWTLGMTNANAFVLGDARWRLARPICGIFGKMIDSIEYGEIR